MGNPETRKLSERQKQQYADWTDPSKVPPHDGAQHGHIGCNQDREDHPRGHACQAAAGQPWGPGVDILSVPKIRT